MLHHIALFFLYVFDFFWYSPRPRNSSHVDPFIPLIMCILFTHSLAIPQRSSFYEEGMLLTEGIEHPHPVFWIHIWKDLTPSSFDEDVGLTKTKDSIFGGWTRAQTFGRGNLLTFILEKLHRCSAALFDASGMAWDFTVSRTRLNGTIKTYNNIQ